MTGMPRTVNRSPSARALGIALFGALSLGGLMTWTAEAQEAAKKARLFVVSSYNREYLWC